MDFKMKDVVVVETLIIVIVLVAVGMGWLQAAWTRPQGLNCTQNITQNVTMKASTLCGLELCTNDTLFCTTIPLKDFDDCSQLMYICADARPGSITWFQKLDFGCAMRYPGANNTLSVPTCSCSRIG